MLNPIQSNPAGWNFEHGYARLPSSLFSPQHPEPVLAPRMILFNDALAEALGLDAASLLGEGGAAVFAGNRLPEGAFPIAQAYAGHQFGGFTNLGDGRAVLLGEHLTPQGARWDIQLKGSGRTSYSRRGDGRAALGPMLREYIVSEAMHALGIPTTRGLAVVATGEPVMREEPLPGAVLTRVAASHIRVGTFEYAAATGDPGLLRALADYTIDRHYPSVWETENPHLAFLRAVMDRQAALIAKWQQVGFIHGVMNTDNMAISGETIDYGPCAFMNRHDTATVFSSIDREGRYAYGNQPAIAQWNLARFAETLLPLLNPDPHRALTLAEEALHTFPGTFRQYWLAGMRTKLGLFNAEEEDQALIASLFDWMREQRADFTDTFRSLQSEGSKPETFWAGSPASEWYAWWRDRLRRQDVTEAEIQARMKKRNPAVIPRNHRVEEALKAAVERDDISVAKRLLAALRNPYEDEAGEGYLSAPAADGDAAYRTFCGT